jgi:hypothetical protein
MNNTNKTAVWNSEVEIGLMNNKIFSGNQPRQVAVKNRRFESRLCPHHQGTDMISEMK